MFSALNDLERQFIKVFPIPSYLLKEESGTGKKLAFHMHAGAVGEIDRLVWGIVFCCVLKGLGHHS